MTTVTLARQAMATRFEIVLHGGNEVSLRAAGEEALQEAERLDARLSFYRPDSEISHLNAHAGREAVSVSPELFGLLQHARQLSEETAGAFDVTIAPLLRCWGFTDADGRLPDPEILDRTRSLIGMHLVHLDSRDGTVRFEREGVMIDLGAIGKGFAVETMVETLKEAGVTSALVHGGTSTIYALGHPPDTGFWKVAIEKPTGPPAKAHHQSASGFGRTKVFALAETGHEAGVPAINPPPESFLTTFALRNEAMSVSAIWGKAFQAGGKTLGHILDPRTARPAGSALLSAVVLPSATETDALSTALLVSGSDGHESIHRLRRGMKTLLLQDSEAGFQLETRGISENQPTRATIPRMEQEAR